MKINSITFFIILLTVSILIFTICIIYNINENDRYKRLENLENFIDISNISNNNKYKIIFSITTSPQRILKLKPVIDSILEQEVDILRINIPKIFKRTGEKYKIPDFIKNNNRIKIFEYDEDYGPTMKVLPTLMEHKDDDNTIIIYGDDDVRILPHLVKTYIKFIKFYPKYIYGMSGLNDFLSKKFEPFYDILNSKLIFEGFMTVAFQSNIFKNFNKMSLIDYYNEIKNNKDCFQSDDLILSNFYEMQEFDRKKISTNKVNSNIWISNMEYFDILGNFGDGLKDLNNGGHKETYKRAYKYLEDKNLAFLDWNKNFDY